jgi:ATP-binding cassette subfamily B protein
MAKFQDIVRYYHRYWRISVFSIAMMSAFEVIDLFGPYAIGQILNVLSHQRLITCTNPHCKRC